MNTLTRGFLLFTFMLLAYLLIAGYNQIYQDWNRQSELEEINNALRAENFSLIEVEIENEKLIKALRQTEEGDELRQIEDEK